MAEIYQTALAAVNEGGVVTMDGGATVVIDRDGRVIVVHR